MIFILKTTDPRRVVTVHDGLVASVDSAGTLPAGWDAAGQQNILTVEQMTAARGAAVGAGLHLLRPSEIFVLAGTGARLTEPARGRTP